MLRSAVWEGPDEMHDWTEAGQMSEVAHDVAEHRQLLARCDLGRRVEQRRRRNAAALHAGLGAQSAFARDLAHQAGAIDTAREMPIHRVSPRRDRTLSFVRI